MKNLQKFDVEELNAFEIENINGGTEYFDWFSFPEGGQGNPVVGIAVAVGNAGVAIANTGIWIWSLF